MTTAGSGRAAEETLRRRIDREQQLVHAAEPLPLALVVDVADELVEAVAHGSSSSSRSASRASALRVRVLTVPSGTCRNAEISLCESPPQ